MLALRLIICASLFAVLHAKYKHMETIRWIYTNFSNGYDIAVNRNIPVNIFDPSVTGSIIPVGTYGDFDDVIDYFYGQNAPFGPIQVPPTKVVFRDYVESGNVASANVDVLIPHGGTPYGDPFTLNNITFGGYYEFTNNTKSATIKRFNIELMRPSEWYREVYPASYGTSNFTKLVIDTTCARHDRFCTGSNNQYPAGDCLQQLANKPFGIIDFGYEDNVMCRFIHSAMTGARPAIHCPHVGPTGGGFCTPSVRPYTSYYADPINAPIVSKSD